MNRDGDSIWNIVLLITLAVVALGFVIWVSRGTPEKYEECKQRCLSRGAETWNWGRYGCECGGLTK